MHAFSGLPTTHSETACCFSPDESLILTGTSAQRDGTGGALLFFDVNKYVWLSALNVVLLLHIHCLFFWLRSGVCFAGVHSLTVLLVHIHCLFCWRAFTVSFAGVQYFSSCKVSQQCCQVCVQHLQFCSWTVPTVCWKPAGSSNIQ